MGDPLYPDLEGPTWPCPLEVGDTVTVTGLLCANNDVGGTLLLEDLKDRECMVTRSFWDYETGWRFVGRLVDQADVDAVRAIGTTGHTAEEYREKYPGNPDLAESTAKALAEFDPSKVYFSIPSPNLGLGS